jgi:hypothetical protein
MRRYAVLFLVSLFFMGMFLPQPAGAFYESDTVTVDYGEFLYFDLSWSYDGTMYVTVKNSYGDYSFDVFFIDASEYSNYKSGSEFYYYEACSRQDTNSYTVTCNVGAGSYYLLFDNTYNGYAQPYDDITFVYTVETTENSNGGDDDYFLSAFMCMVLGIVGLIFIIVIVAVVVSKRRKKTVMVQQTPPPAQHYPQHQHQHSQPPQAYGAPVQHTSPPPSTPPGYSPPPQPQQQHHQSTEAKQPPKLELPGMIGGTEDTLEDTYSGPPKPPKQ